MDLLHFLQTFLNFPIPEIDFRAKNRFELFISQASDIRRHVIDNIAGCYFTSTRPNFDNEKSFFQSQQKQKKAIFDK
jgi:hypothetical protein